MTNLRQEMEERLVGQSFDMKNGSKFLVAGFSSTISGNHIRKTGMNFHGTLTEESGIHTIVGMSVQEFFNQVILNDRVEYFLDTYPEFFI